MKYLKSSGIWFNSARYSEIFKLWLDTADQMTLKYGIHIKVNSVFLEDGIAWRIYFKIENHEFDSLIDLEKALQNRAFM